MLFFSFLMLLKNLINMIKYLISLKLFDLIYVRKNNNKNNIFIITSYNFMHYFIKLNNSFKLFIYIHIYIKI